VPEEVLAGRDASEVEGLRSRGAFVHDNKTDFAGVVGRSVNALGVGVEAVDVDGYTPITEDGPETAIEV
jgi:hypothetical protein